MSAVFMLAAPFVILAVLITITVFYVRKNRLEVWELWTVFGFYGLSVLAYLLPLTGMVFSEWLPMSWSLGAIITGYIMTVVCVFFSILLTCLVRLRKQRTRMVWYIVCWSLTVFAFAVLIFFTYLT